MDQNKALNVVEKLIETWLDGNYRNVVFAAKFVVVL